MNISAFQTTVLSHYKKHGRHTLPWRKTRDPYKILVSEVMLQQTQVDRVIPKYSSFVRKFYSLKILAKTPLREVLKEWQGLGYNRRAKFLHDTTRAVLGASKNGALPRSVDELQKLPGIGPYTARAIATFAYGQRHILIETNIRSVFIHHYADLCGLTRRTTRKIGDIELLPLIEKTLPAKNAREWYWALMDYGAYLKKTLPNPSRRSTHHVRQKPFRGSQRQVRGAILHVLAEKKATLSSIIRTTKHSRMAVQNALTALQKDGLVQVKKGSYAL